jgi:hypothetical protein
MINHQPKGESFVAATTKWEYDFVIVSDMGPTKFVQFLQDRENRGWEFNGQVSIVHDGKPGASAWLFRRPAKTAVNRTANDFAETLNSYAQGRYADFAAGLSRGDANQERIKQLEAELARLKNAAANKTSDVKQEKVFKPDELPLGASEMADILRRLAVKRYGYERLECTVYTPGSLLGLRGDKESVDWAAGIISALMKK